MNSTTFRMPVRRWAGAAAVAALATGPVLAAAPAAHAVGTSTAGSAATTTGEGATTTGKGTARAAVLRAALDVGLLDKSVRVPLKATLNEVHAPATAERTALGVRLDGVEGGRPVDLLRADVATAKATADERRAEGSVTLADARVHVPGLPLLSLVEAETVTARAVCEAGRRPVAASNLLGRVTVLGKRVTLTAGGPTTVKVPGVGEVTLRVSERTVTTTTAAATALELTVSVDPLKLNVAEVEGTLTLAEAACAAPAPGRPASTPTPEPAASGAPAVPKPEQPQGDGLKVQAGGEAPAHESLAETGGSSRTPYVAGGAAALLGAGAAALVIARRASRASRTDRA
ncbi:SCO1860 family LAETG-anchored protein [Streptomyces coeruleoprunus]|uniref:SCO1860 family LAETG-anchored protein n=1 Tax=Streptomyces coeruleoprunus TaxID=285563 RepID=A0ABV9XN61_9ACTN